MMTSIKLNPAELPLEVFDHIMFLLSSLHNSVNYTSLMNCRLVCKDWKKKSCAASGIIRIKSGALSLEKDLCAAGG